MEIDLSIPGPIKIFSRISRQYSVQPPAYPLQDIDEDLLLYLPSTRGGPPLAPPSVRFLRVGEPDNWRVARLGRVGKMRPTGLSIDRDAGYVIIWGDEVCHQSTRECSFIWWLDVRKPGNMVYTRTKELISSRSRGLLRRL